MGSQSRQIDVEALGGAAPQPLAVAHHDVERRLGLAELLEHLILKAGPGDLVDLDLDLLAVRPNSLASSCSPSAGAHCAHQMVSAFAAAGAVAVAGTAFPVASVPCFFWQLAASIIADANPAHTQKVTTGLFAMGPLKLIVVGTTPPNAGRRFAWPWAG